MDSTSDARNKGLELGKFTAEGATSLFFSKIAQQIVSVVGSLILIRLLVSPGVYALIAISTTLPGLVMLGNFLGLGSGLTRYLSIYKTNGDSDGIWSSFWSGLPLTALLGSLLVGIAYFAADPIALLIGKASVLTFLKIASPLPLVWVLQLTVKGTLLPLGRARAYSLYQILDEVLLSSFPIVAVLLGYGVVGALIGMVIANYVSVGVALGIAVSTVFASTQKERRRFTFKSSSKTIIKYGLPLGVANNYGTFAGQVMNLIVARFVSLDIYGLYSVASSASVFASYVTDPVNTMISPMFARVKGLENRDLLRTVYRQAVRYASLLFFPAALFFTIFAEPFLILFFGQSYAGGGIYLTIMSGMGLTYGLANTATYTLLASQGYSKFCGSMSMLTATFSMIVALVVIPTLGFLPFLIVSGLVFLPSFSMTLKKTKATFGISPPFSSVKRLYLATLLAGLVSVPLLFVPLPSIAEVILGLLVTFASYIFWVIVIQAISLQDTGNLKSMLSTQPAVAWVVSPFFKLFDVLIRNIGSEKNG